jgi:hypothetical protein
MFGADNLVPLRGLGGGAAFLTGSCACGSTSGYSHCVLAGREFSIGKSYKTAFYAFISSYGVRFGAVSGICFDYLCPVLVCIKLESKDTSFFSIKQDFFCFDYQYFIIGARCKHTYICMRLHLAPKKMNNRPLS